MDHPYSRGDPIIIETTAEGWFTGQFYSKLQDGIKVTQVKKCGKGESTDILTFYNSEITSVKPGDSSEVLSSMFHVVRLSNVELEKHAITAKRWIFINQVDEDYKRAVQNLLSYAYVALGSDGAEMGRKCKLSLLTLSTPTQIYIFDIQAMQQNAFDNGLRELLESKDVKKIIHTAENMADCLLHKHSVELDNVFDTQIADIFVHRNKHGCLPEKMKTLQECISLHLGIPNGFIEKVDIVEWAQRPVKVKVKEVASQNIVYLHRLSEVLYDEMQKPFNLCVKFITDRLRRCDDLDAWHLSGQGKQLMLAEEVKQLADCMKKN